MTEKKDGAEPQQEAEAGKEVEQTQELESSEAQSETGGEDIPSTAEPEEAELAAAQEVEAEVEQKEAESAESEQETAEPEEAHTQAAADAPKKGLMQRRKSFAQTSVPNAHRGYNPKTPVVMLGIIAVFLIASFILAALTT